MEQRQDETTCQTTPAQRESDIQVELGQEAKQRQIPRAPISKFRAPKLNIQSH
jgi:hypothetical protein